MVMQEGSFLPGWWLGLFSNSSPVIDVVVMCSMCHDNLFRTTDENFVLEWKIEMKVSLEIRLNTKKVHERVVELISLCGGSIG